MSRGWRHGASVALELPAWKIWGVSPALPGGESSLASAFFHFHTDAQYWYGREEVDISILPVAERV